MVAEVVRLRLVLVDGQNLSEVVELLVVDVLLPSPAAALVRHLSALILIVAAVAVATTAAAAVPKGRPIGLIDRLVLAQRRLASLEVRAK